MDGIVEVLQRHAQSCDADTISYMAAMVEEEFLCGSSNGGGPTAETVLNLVGTFLADAGLDATAVSKRIAEDLKRFPHSARKQGAAAAVEGPQLLKEAFSAGAFLAESCKEGFSDPCLGLKRVNVNFNAQVPLDEAVKAREAQAKAREQQLRRMRDWEKQRLPLPPPRKFHGDVQKEKLTDIQVHAFSVAVAGRDLLTDTQLKIVIGRKYGLVGRNGIGKSTFLGALVRKEIPGIPRDVTIGCVEQEFSEDLLSMTPVQCLLEVDEERTRLLKREAELLGAAQNEATAAAVAAVQERLHDIESESAEAAAASILAGLQLTPAMQRQKVRELSGGWRVRVALGRALFATPDILCLDEPTNHLDLHAVAWLTDHLQNLKGTCIVVSHSRNFLNDVCSDIIDFRDKKLHYYRGDFDTFERTRIEALRLQQRRFEAQQAKREHTQKFIDRFRAKASKAALVQSRIKALEKLPLLEEVAADPSLTFTFKEPEKLPMPILQISGGYFTYKAGEKIPSKDADCWILKDVDLNVDLNSRIAICGVNGSGKTTLLRMLCGQSQPQRGTVTRNNRLRIGFFSQHFVDSMDLTLNAVQLLQQKHPEVDIKDEAARNFLGGFGVTGMLAVEPLYVLSGGQKSRVAFALMAFQTPHILILDEPTNHLDLDAIQALIAALNNFEGGLIVVSHDTHLLSCVADDVYYVSSQLHRLVKYPGDVEQYRKDLLRKTASGGSSDRIVS